MMIADSKMGIMLPELFIRYEVWSAFEWKCIITPSTTYDEHQNIICVTIAKISGCLNANFLASVV
jgi:hypothetical protein